MLLVLKTIKNRKTLCKKMKTAKNLPCFESIKKGMPKHATIKRLLVDPDLNPIFIPQWLSPSFASKR